MIRAFENETKFFECVFYVFNNKHFQTKKNKKWKKYQTTQMAQELALNSDSYDLFLFASIWTAPPWMKVNTTSLHKKQKKRCYLFCILNFGFRKIAIL